MLIAFDLHSVDPHMSMLCGSLSPRYGLQITINFCTDAFMTLGRQKFIQLRH